MRFADHVAGMIRAQQYDWSDSFMGSPFLVNNDREGPVLWRGCAPNPSNDLDWNLGKNGITWRSIYLTRGENCLRVQLSKRDKKLLNAAWWLAKALAKLAQRKAKNDRKAAEEEAAFLKIGLDA